jgi:sodium-dependent dicarboxylate transporter 2/3/5
MVVFTPLTIMLLMALYFVTVKMLYPNHIKHSEQGKKFIEDSLNEMGKLTTPEKRVLAVFFSVVLCWICKDLINKWQSLVVLDDTIIALAGAIVLFMIPSGRKNSTNEERLLEWDDTKKMAWGILILFGGGLALAKALEEVKLMEQFGAFIASYSTNNVLVMMLIVLRRSPSSNPLTWDFSLFWSKISML